MEGVENNKHSTIALLSILEGTKARDTQGVGGERRE